MKPDDPHVRETVEALEKHFIEKGLLVEAGWQSFKILIIPDYATPEQVNFGRLAFFSGAQHLWGSIMTVLDPESEPTARDLKRMDFIYDELERFAGDLKFRLAKPEGHS